MHASTTGDVGQLVRLNAVEPLKWLALVLMLAEHVSYFAFDRLSPAVMFVGRLVFPLFAIALALGVWDKTPAQRLQVVQRLAMWCGVAAIAGLLVRSALPLNVLATFALGITAHTVWHSIGPGRRLIAAGLVLVGFCCEYGPWGVLAVALLVEWAGDQRGARGWCYFGGALLLICAANGNLFALGAGVVAIAVSEGGLEVPRIRRLFYWTYAGQWPAIALLKAVV